MKCRLSGLVRHTSPAPQSTQSHRRRPAVPGRIFSRQQAFAIAHAANVKPDASVAVASKLHKSALITGAGADALAVGHVFQHGGHPTSAFGQPGSGRQNRAIGQGNGQPIHDANWVGQAADFGHIGPKSGTKRSRQGCGAGIVAGSIQFCRPRPSTKHISDLARSAAGRRVTRAILVTRAA